MKRRTAMLTLAAFCAAPATAREYGPDIPAGFAVFSSDGRFVGALRSRPRKNDNIVQLIINTKGPSIFRHVREDLRIDVPESGLTINPDAVILPATAITLRNRLQYRPRYDDIGRIFL